jgi:hypothetical protein
MTPTINEENQVRLGFDIEDGIDFCNYCNITLTNENVVIFNFCSNDVDDTIIYCKPCAAILRGDMNIKTGESNGITMCYMCKISQDECKCNAKKIDYNLRKTLK